MATGRRNSDKTVAPKPELIIVPRTGAKGVSKAGAAAERADEALQGLGAVVGDAAEKFWTRLAAGAGEAVPDEVELTLEVGLEGKQTWILVEGKASAKASVKLKWKTKGA